MQLSSDRLVELSGRGITDVATGIERAVASRQAILSATRLSLEGHALSADASLIALFGLVGRAQAFHEGATEAIARDNPFAAAAALRSYSETVAALVWLRGHSDELWRFGHDAKAADTPTIGRLTNYAKLQYPAFGTIYNQLSAFAHPTPRGGLLGITRLTDEGAMTWQTAPTFGSDGARMMFCFWVVECAEFAGELLVGQFSSYWQHVAGPQSQ